MCKKTNYKIPNPRIDKCMNFIISYLNRNGIETVACCCGHKKYPMTIIVNNSYENFDLITGKTIPRTRNFYKRDKEGYYYIPEVIK